jgi:hypothetical protein
VNVDLAEITHLEGYLVAPDDLESFLDPLIQVLEKIKRP